jgi:hypothetical protein
MESEDTFYIRLKVEDNVYTQTSYTGQIRWRQKEKGSQELILQQQVHSYHVVHRRKTNSLLICLDY